MEGQKRFIQTKASVSLRKMNKVKVIRTTEKKHIKVNLKK